MKSAIAILLLAVAAGLTFAQEGPEADFARRAAKTNDTAADTHLSLARWCFKQGMNVEGHVQAQRALKLVPQHDKTMRELGYKKRRVDGEDTWEHDPKRAPAAKDADGIKPDTRRKYRTERDKAYKSLAVEYVKLGRYAEGLELAAHARAAYELAVGYDPLNETAMAGAGWVKHPEDGWLSPAEARERAATQAALDDAPGALELETLPAWASAVYGRRAKGVRVGNVTVIGSGDDLADFGRYAHAAATLTAALLGGTAGEITLAVALGKAEHEAYCKARHGDTPASIDHTWLILDAEAEVMCAEEQRVSLERAVYAVTLIEVRRRCGESQSPWFETGFAGNMTRRLLGRVSVVEFSGVAGGPSEPGRWKRTLQMLLAEEQAPALPKALVERAPDENQTILLHFFVRYLCHARAAALPAWCAAIKREDDVEAALKAAWDQDSVAMEAAFIEWFRG